MTTTPHHHRNRESWLTDCAKLLRPLMRERAGLVPGPYRVSCGWPSRGGLSSKRKTVGQCWQPTNGDHREIFISPVLDYPEEVAATLLHEMIHAALPAAVGHRKQFSQACKKVGLEGKPTSTVPGEALLKTIREMVAQLGEYPHDKIIYDGGSKQTTRLLKVMCPACGYIARVTRQWMEEVGGPVCKQCWLEMEYADPGAVATDPLRLIANHAEYAVGGTERFRIRMANSKKRGGLQWWIIDYEAWRSTPGAQPPKLATLADLTALTDDPEEMLRKAAEVFTTPVPPRLTPAEDRHDAIAMIESLLEEQMTYDDLEVDDDVEEWSENDLHYLAEDEEEEPDDPSLVLTPEEEAIYEREQGSREAWVQDEAA